MAFIQKIVRNEREMIDIAFKYYSIMSILHNLNLPVRQTQLLAFTAIRGTITPLSAREDFISMFGSSLNSIENMKGILHKQGLLIIQGKMYKVNPNICPDFSQEKFIFQIHINKTEESDS